jgi:hypothetical protein
MSALNSAEQRKQALLVEKLRAATAAQRAPPQDGNSRALVPVEANASTAVAASTDTALTATDVDEAKTEKEYNAGMLAKVLSDLETKAAVHQETMKIIESSQVWQDYDSHVAFEMFMLKHRYSSTPDVALNTARRAQMQAHLREKQRQIMELHAEKAAEAYLESLTTEERAALMNRLMRIEAPPTAESMGAALGSASAREAVPQVSDEELRAALEQLSAEVTAQARAKATASSGIAGGAGKAGGEAGAPSDASFLNFSAAGKTFAELAAERKARKAAGAGKGS